jgi:hypothetical protein
MWTQRSEHLSMRDDGWRSVSAGLLVLLDDGDWDTSTGRHGDGRCWPRPTPAAAGCRSHAFSSSRRRGCRLATCGTRSRRAALTYRSSALRSVAAFLLRSISSVTLRGRPRRSRPHQPRDRPAALHLAPHRRNPPCSRIRQTGPIVACRPRRHSHRRSGDPGQRSVATPARLGREQTALLSAACEGRRAAVHAARLSGRRMHERHFSVHSLSSRSAADKRSARH